MTSNPQEADDRQSHRSAVKTATYRLDDVFGRRDLICQAASELVGESLDGAAFQSLINAFASQLPSRIPRDLLRESLVPLAGRILTQEELTEYAWRLAGNQRRLMMFRPVLPWNRQALPELVPVQVLSVDRVYRRRKPYAAFTFQVLAGSPATLRMRRVWSVRFCYFLSRGFGFSGPRGEFPCSDPREFVGFRCYVLVEPRLCGSSPAFEHLHLDEVTRRILPSSMFSHNRAMIKLRQRENGEFDCPRNFPATNPCHRCFVGQDECALAVHAATFRRRMCRRCQKPGWIDPLHAGMCVECRDRQLRADS